MANQWNSAIYWNSAWTWGGGDLEGIPYEANYIFSEVIGVMTNILVAETGKEFRYSKGQPRREFRLVYTNRSETVKDALLTFFGAREGNYDSFYWVNPNDSTTYEVRFKEGSLDVDYVDYDIYNINFSLMELI